ncbi:uncharacterized protein LOC111704235 [Eurytemora carolleeae]|uniref:uncharacterized protein LOC111704235 n=1 Tax=Eurytemora carolleeae TaxID=1294199 RepID=UPI000C790206|nr:uncharacterized protein LOC111704235 [Eurytemora carolleeae]|eukprot:XP_023332159.1 uncharacterized protein LOC111704235 [Eurytemora affinis]
MKEVRDGVLTFQEDKLNSATIAVIGASSTVGSIVVSMLAARGFNVVGVCSAGNGEAVLRNGAVGVLDRNKGGLKLKGEMKLDIVIDAVGGQVAEDSGREALEGSGHFITVVGPTEFGEGTDGGMKNIGNGMSITSRKMKSMFSSVKYSLASMPLYVRDILEKLVEEGVSVILDSEVELLNEEAVKTAIDKVRLHKTRGRLVLVNN